MPSKFTGLFLVKNLANLVASGIKQTLKSIKTNFICLHVELFARQTVLPGHDRKIIFLIFALERNLSKPSYLNGDLLKVMAAYE